MRLWCTFRQVSGPIVGRGTGGVDACMQSVNACPNTWHKYIYIICGKRSNTTTRQLKVFCIHLFLFSPEDDGSVFLLNVYIHWLEQTMSWPISTNQREKLVPSPIVFAFFLNDRFVCYLFFRLKYHFVVLLKIIFEITHRIALSVSFMISVNKQTE